MHIPLNKFFSNKLPVIFTLAGILCFVISTAAHSDPYPPLWDDVGGLPANDPLHYEVADWPGTDAFDLSSWTPVYHNGATDNDPRTSDPSNGGTRPQNYANVSSSCTDTTSPSVYWAFDDGGDGDPATGTIFFRWRVEQIANTYATGPSPGSFSSSDPWNSALWTVFIDTDGDGFREFAMHLDGSTGSPSTQIDILAAIYSDTPSQSLDYENDPSINFLSHNPTAFVDNSTDIILNFHSTNSPDTSWPNSSAETVWDYGTTRSVLFAHIGNCYEYYVDYQIPLGFLDASAVGGPTITENSPISMFFATANSLQNPLQKDAVLEGAFTASPDREIPFGDFIRLSDGSTFEQPIIDVNIETGCGPVLITSQIIQDAMIAPTSTSVATTVIDVEYWYYYDEDADGIANDGSVWTYAVDATQVGLSLWQGTWDSSFATGLRQGQYLIGVIARDDSTYNADGQTHVTFTYYSQTELDAFIAADPATRPLAGEEWYVNPDPDPGVQYGLFNNTCGVPPPSVSKTVSPSEVPAGGTATYTITITNDTIDPITLTQINDLLPSGFSFDADNGGTLTPTTSPGSGDSGTISWTFTPGITIAASSFETLIFDATVSTVTGTYSNIAQAVITEEGTLESDQVQVTVGEPRLTISKSADASSKNPGATITYTITYSNDSPVDVTNTVITDTLSNDLTFVTATGGGLHDGSPTGGTITWSIGSLLAGNGPYSVTFQATVADPYPVSSPINLDNTATIDSNETGPASASASTYINSPRPVLSIQKSSDALLYNNGATVTYTINFYNTGTEDATGTTIVDTLPAGLTFVSSTLNGSPIVPAGSNPYTFTVNSSDTATAGQVTALQTGTLVITATVSATSGTLTNIAQIDSTDIPTPVSDSVDIGINSGACSNTTYYFHETTQDVGTLTNRIADTTAPTSSTASTTGIIIVGPVGAGFTELRRYYQDPPMGSNGQFSGNITINLYVDKSGSPQAIFQVDLFDYDPLTGATVSIGTGQVSVPGNTTNSLQSITITPTGGLQPGHRLLWVISAGNGHISQTNNVALSYDGTLSPSNSIFCFNEINLQLSKSADITSAAVGDPVTYTINFANPSAANATGAVITDTLGTGLTIIDDGSTSPLLNGTYFAPTGTNPYTFTVNSSDTGTAGQLTSGQSGTLVLKAIVNGSAGVSVDNAVDLDSNQTLTISDTAATFIKRPDVSISKSADNTYLDSVPEIVTYTLAVTNNGDGNASNVTVTDALPLLAGQDLAYVSNSTKLDGGIGTDDMVDGTYDIGTLTPGQTRVVTFQMQTVAPLEAGVNTFDNTASVTDFQTSGSVNSNTVTVTVDGNPNLTVSKIYAIDNDADSSGDESTGDTILYTITVQNTGTSSATSTKVYDPIPSYTQFVVGSLVSPSGGSASFDGPNSRVVFDVGTLAAGASRTMSFKVQIDASISPAGTYGISNTATVTSTNALTKESAISFNVTTAPNLDITKTGTAFTAYPATNVNGMFTGVATFTVEDSTYLTAGQYILVNSQYRKITDISGFDVTVDSNVTVNDGDTVVGSISYILNYSNSGDANSTNTVVKDILPAAINYYSALPAPASSPAVGNSGTVQWDIGTLMPDRSGIVTVIAFPSSSGTHTDTASIESTEVPNPVTATFDTHASAIVENPVIGIAKIAGVANSNGDGTYTASITLFVKNYDSVLLKNVQVTDNLNSTFGAPASLISVTNLSSSIFTINTSYNGSTDTNLLAGTDILLGEEVGLINFDVTFTSGGLTGPFNNQANASGTSPGGTTTSDTSDYGTNPDPDDDGVPDESGENDLTPISFSALGIAKEHTSSVDNGDGTYTASITITLENLGSFDLDFVQVTDDLDSIFSGTASLVSVANLSSSTLSVNSSFDGETDIELLDGTDTLTSGSSGTITFDVRYNPGSETGPFNNQAEASGEGPNGENRDLSDDGTDPDPDGDGNPSETDENDPTPIAIPTTTTTTTSTTTSTTTTSTTTITVPATTSTTTTTLPTTTTTNPTTTSTTTTTVPTTTTTTTLPTTTTTSTTTTSTTTTTVPTTTTTTTLPTTTTTSTTTTSTTTTTVPTTTTTTTLPTTTTTSTTTTSTTTTTVSTTTTTSPTTTSTTTTTLPATLITGQVFNDINGDGIKDFGETPLSNVTVVLLDLTNTIIGVTTTAADGSYEFINIPPGSYTLRESDPAGYISTTINIVPVSISYGGTVYVNFGDQPVGTVSGVVFHDYNGNGLQEIEENVITGVTVELIDSTGSIVETTTTDTFGSYLFTGISAGLYTVRETDATGYVSTTSNTVPVSVVASGAETANFGDTLSSTISGTVFEDLNGSGTMDVWEYGIPSVIVKLYDSNDNEIGSALTDTDGTYTFLDVAPGNYLVEETDPGGYGSTTTNIIPVSVDSTSFAIANFGDIQDSSISGLVFNDVNGNGIRDIGENPIVNVLITLKDDTNTVIGQTVTDASGVYFFTDLPAGSYTVSETDPSGYFSTTGNTAFVNLSDGGTGTANFGDQQTGSVSGVVFNDFNGNGIQDPGENGIGGVVIELHDDNGLVLQTVITAGNGSYIFVNVFPGNYTIWETDPDGFESTTNNFVPVSINSNSGGTANFGDKQAGTISGVVFNDINGSGVQDPGEFGLGNVLISLLDNTGTVIATGISDAAGMYQFYSIGAGEYTVQETDPEGFTSTTGNTVSVSLATGSTGTANFGDKQSGVVSGIVFNDMNENGLQDRGELGISGVTVELFNAAGNLIHSTLTGSNGVYGFMNVETGMYSVLETDPNGYFSTTGNTAAVTLAAGGTGTANFGDKQSGGVSGIVFNDMNENGLQDGGELGISGVTVELFNAAGSLVQSTLTGSNGVYGFTNVEPGMYSVLETDPNGYFSTTGNSVTFSFAAGEAGSADFGDKLITNHPNIYDPPSAWKSIISSEPVIIWQMLWINDSNVDALLVRVSDMIPPDTEFAGYVDASDGTAWYDMATDVIFWEGNIPAQGQVKIWYSTTVPTDSDFTENQASGIWDQNGNSDLSDDISAKNNPVYTDDPYTRELLDPTQWTREQCTSSIGGILWLDPCCCQEEKLVLISKPGFGYIVQKEFEDRITPLDGVLMDLYLDINQDGHYTEGTDTLLMSSETGMNLTTGQEGYYSFDALCPGDFTIRVSPYNFEPEGVLEGNISQDGETDITITLPDADSVIDDVDFKFVEDSSQ